MFESQLRWLARQEWHTPSSFDEIRELLDNDGFEFDERCTIHWRRPPALEATLAGLTDPSGIRAELERVRRALPDDPAGAIGTAKQLVEATAKVTLTERSHPLLPMPSSRTREGRPAGAAAESVLDSPWTR